MPSRELLGIIKLGKLAWNQFKASSKLRDLDLKQADLHDHNLDGFDFSQVNLREANLKDCSFANVNFERANLTGADLHGAKLVGAKMMSAILRRTKFSHNNLLGTDLRACDMENAKLYRVNGQGVDFQQAVLNNATLKDCNLDSAKFQRVVAFQADFSGSSLRRACLDEARVDQALFMRTDLRGALLNGLQGGSIDLSGANVQDASFQFATMPRVNLQSAICDAANFGGSDMVGANLGHALLRATEFVGANLDGADLTEAVLTRTNLSRANISNARVFGASIWDVNLTATTQDDLVITPTSEPSITLDNLEMAQFIYLLLKNAHLRGVIDAITSKVVLILGRFSNDRLPLLRRLRSTLRSMNYAPVLFDFEKPSSRDLTETISTLAHLSRFVIADISDPRSIPHELMRIVPTLPSVPIQPIISLGQTEYGMFEHFRSYGWVMPICTYRDIDDLQDQLSTHLIDNIERTLLRQGSTTVAVKSAS